MNSKGQMAFGESLFKVLLMLCIFLGVMFLIWGISIVGPIITGGSSEISSVLNTVANEESDKNLSTAITVPTNAVNTTVQSLDWVAYIMVLLLLLVCIIFCATAGDHPYVIGIWIAFIFVFAWVAMLLSNNYADIANNASLLGGESYAAWETDALMRNFPAIIISIGVIGGIVMAFFAARRPGVQENIIQ